MTETGSTATASGGRATTRGARLLSPLAVLLVIAPACGSDDIGKTAQPTPDASTFVRGSFDELPRYPRSDPLGPVSRKRETIARSYRARAATPEQVLDYFNRELEGAGWAAVEGPRAIGKTTWRGRWRRGDEVVVVSATNAPTLGDDARGDDVFSQYSVSLTRPD